MTSPPCGSWRADGSPTEPPGAVSICFLKQAKENRIRRLPPQEALAKLMGQTIHRMSSMENLDLMLSHLERLVRMIPVYELENRPEPEAARLSYETMHQGAEEMGL